MDPHGAMGWHKHGEVWFEQGAGCAGVLAAHAKPRGARRGAWCAGSCAVLDELPRKAERRESKIMFPTGVWSLCHDLKHPKETHNKKNNPKNTLLQFYIRIVYMKCPRIFSENQF